MNNRQKKKGRMASPRHRRGVAAVEFALIAPLFLLFLAGIIEFGQVFRIEHMLTTASRRGARSAIVNGATTSEVQQNVKTQLVQILGVNEEDVTVEVAVNGSAGTNVSEAEEGDEISVTASIPYSKAAAGFYANMFSTSIISATCIFEHE